MTWPTARLDQLAHSCLGKMLDKQKNRGTMRPYLRNVNVRWGNFDLSDLQGMPFEDREAERYTVQPGDLVVCEGGEPGRCAVWRLPEPVFIQKALHRVRCGPKLNAVFLAYWLRHRAMSGRLAGDCTGTTIQHLPGVTLAALAVPHPVLSEQHRIVEAIETHFSRLDAAVAALTRAKANVKRGRASVLEAAVEGRLVPTEAALARAEGRGYEPGAALLQRILAEREASWGQSGAKGKYKPPVAPDTAALPSLPEGWAHASIDALCTRITSGSRDWSQFYGTGTSVFVLAQNVRRRKLDLSTVQVVDPPAGDPASTRSAVQQHDLLVTIVGANTGEACRVPAPLEAHYVCQSVALLRPADAGTSRYAEVWLDGEPLKKTWQRYMYGQGRPHLGFDDLRRSPVMLPPLAEQHRIVAEVDRRLSVLDALDQSLDLNLARCQRLRQAILKRAFEGRLVPPTPAEAQP